MLFTRTTASLVATLLIAAAGGLSAQSPTQAAPPQPAPPQTGVPGPQAAKPQTGVQQPQAAKPQPGAAAQPNARRQRPSRRSRRASPRRPAPAVPAPVGQARASRDGGPTVQQVTLTANALGGYDTNPSAGFAARTGASTFAGSGSTGYADMTLGYFQGNTRRSLRLDATGNLRAYPDYVGRAAAGGGAAVEGRIPLSRNVFLSASERVLYEPFYSVVSAGASTVPLPPGMGGPLSATALFARGSASSYTAIGVERAWTQRDTTSLSYAYRTQRFTDSRNGNNSGHDVQAEYRRHVTPGVTARGRYGYLNGEYNEYTGAALPTRGHRIEGGADIETSLSRRHHLTVSLSGGANYVQSVTGGDREPPYHAWVPVGTANARLTLSTRWSGEGGYQRNLSMFRGATAQVYTTDTAFLATRRTVSTWIDLRAGATYTNWSTLLASGTDATLRMYGAFVQAAFVMTPKLSATANYSYYHHRYSDPGALPPNFPPQYDRHAVTIGLSVSVPLRGAPAAVPLIPR